MLPVALVSVRVDRAFTMPEAAEVLARKYFCIVVHCLMKRKHLSCATLGHVRAAVWQAEL